jgi:hypothetical protein
LKKSGAQRLAAEKVRRIWRGTLDGSHPAPFRPLFTEQEIDATLEEGRMKGSKSCYLGGEL